jgi:hypothetical protein
MGGAARERAGEFYEWGRLGARLRRVYADALGEGPLREGERP